MPAMQMRIRHVVFLLALLLGLLPPVAYWLSLGRLPTVSPEGAKDLLAKPNTAAVLVDVRLSSEFAASHLDAAQNWPFEQIAALGSAEAVPEQFKGKRLLLICNDGFMSGLAARKLLGLGVSGVENVQGGMGAWVASGQQPCPLGLFGRRRSGGEPRGLPFRESSVLEQAGAVLSGFVVKPIYTLLALALVVVLWRQKPADLVAMRWAIIFFFIGENFCGANYIVYTDRSYLFEYLHDLGMVLCFGFATYAVIEGMDLRFIKLSDPQARCAALGLCHRCIKHAEVPCGLQRVFMLIILAFMAICFMPFCAPLAAVSYNTRIFGTFHNYSDPIVYQMYETRFCPAVALAFFAVSFALLSLERNALLKWAKVFFAGGVGALGFCFLRLILLHAYADHMVWFNFWEEVTELLFVAGTGFVLWVFRDGLFGRKDVRE